jgi:hypothetical protein
MAAMSDYLENKLIDHVFRGVSYTAPSGLYIGLLTAAPSDSGGGTEVGTSGTNYARASLAPSTGNWAATNGATTTTNPSSGTSGTTSNNSAITFNAPSGRTNWGNITHVGVYDSATVGAGNLLFWCALTTPKNVNSGDAAPSFAISQLTFQIDN